MDTRGARDLDFAGGDRDGVIVRHHVLAHARRPDPAPYQRGNRWRRGAHSGTIDSTERVAGGKLDFQPYPSLPAALHAIDSQNVYAALDVASQRPTLYVASAAGASVARVLERIATVDPGVRVRDTHPLSVHDPNGLNIFYLMLVTTIVGFLTVFQVLANAGQLPRRHQIAFVAGLALTASLVLTLVDGPLLNRLALPVPETWGILALQLLAAASFTSLMVALIGRWAILPTWLFVVVLGNASSGGAVSPPLLPAGVRVLIPVASRRLDRHGTARRDLLRPPPARPADRRPRDMGDAAVRRVALGLTRREARATRKL